MRRKVLLVDDETEFVELVEYNLGNREFEIFTAFNGVEALHQARLVLPDVILLDLMLPDIDGVTVCEILRAQPSTADVPVIVVSALDGMIMRGTRAEPGINCYFKKPVDFRMLGKRVRELCKQHREHLKSRFEMDDDSER